MGLLPQVNTFTMYVLEQVEMHVFGGSATTSLMAAVFTVARSCVAVGFLYGFCYVGIKVCSTNRLSKYPICYNNKVTINLLYNKYFNLEYTAK